MSRSHCFLTWVLTSLVMAGMCVSAPAAWEGAVDPPAQAVKLDLAADYAINFPSERFSFGHGAVFPTTPSRYVLLGESGNSAVREVWDLVEKKKAGQLNAPIRGTDRCAISPDGRWYAIRDFKSVNAWSLDGQNRLKSISTGRFRAEAFDLLSNDRLLTVASDGDGEGLVLWDLNTAAAIGKLPGRLELFSKSVCVSPGQNWLAAVRRNPNELQLVDLRAMKVRETIPLPKPANGFWWDCDGLAFSPDGNELAGLFRVHNEWRLWCWNMKTGERATEITLRGLPRTARTPRTLDASDLAWMPDGRAWLVAGRTLVDRTFARPTMTLSPPKAVPMYETPTPVGGGRLAVVSGAPDAPTFRTIALPMDAVEAARKSMDGVGAALLKPGATVSLKIDISAVRFAEKEKVEAALRGALKQRLEAERFAVADDAPVTLTVKYEEAAGKSLSFRPRRNPFAPQVPPLNPAPEKSEKSQSTGTGFVITSDGSIATCAHVVGDAKTVEVAIGEKKHTGTVVARDTENDLALVKIEAKDLAVLPLADSDKVELGEELRVFGFPLSDTLGDSVKSTRGSLAGIVKRNNRKLFQVDASVNPGNSGGPTVDEKGNVVGVTSQKVVGTVIDNVGLVVPSNTLRPLLEKNAVKVDTAPSTEKLDGPALFKKVAKAVVLITSTGSTGSGTTEAGTITSTLITADLTLAAKGDADPLWSTKIATDPSIVTVTGQATETTIRDSVYKQFEGSLAGIDLPYFVSSDKPRLRLPVVVELPK